MFAWRGNFIAGCFQTAVHLLFAWPTSRFGLGLVFKFFSGLTTVSCLDPFVHSFASSVNADRRWAHALSGALQMFSVEGEAVRNVVNLLFGLCALFIIFAHLCPNAGVSCHSHPRPSYALPFLIFPSFRTLIPVVSAFVNIAYSCLRGSVGQTFLRSPNGYSVIRLYRVKRRIPTSRTYLPFFRLLYLIALFYINDSRSLFIFPGS